MIYTIQSNYIRSNVLEWFEEVDNFLSLYDEDDSYILAEGASIIERFIDGFKMAFSKDKQAILEKYKKYIDKVNEYNDEIKKLESIHGKSKINIQLIYEYYQVTVPTGNGGYMVITYERDANFVYDIIDIKKEFDKISSMSDKSSKKKYLKNIQKKYSGVLLYSNYKVLPKRYKGSIYDVAKKASDNIKYFKDISDDFIKVCTALGKSLKDAESLIKTLKSEHNENVKYLKRLLSTQKEIYLKDNNYLLAVELAASKQSNVLKKYINKIKSNVGTE